MLWYDALWHSVYTNIHHNSIQICDFLPSDITNNNKCIQYIGTPHILPRVAFQPLSLMLLCLVLWRQSGVIINKLIYLITTLRSSFLSSCSYTRLLPIDWRKLKYFLKLLVCVFLEEPRLLIRLLIDCLMVVFSNSQINKKFAQWIDILCDLIAHVQ
jgi:hypothetical protein